MSTQDVTLMLRAWRGGDRGALDQLLPAVYNDLRRIARARLAGERRGHLQPTALVHESYVRLIDQHRVDWQDRNHFLAVAARTMRRVLIEEARRRQAAKRGGDAITVELNEALGVAEKGDVDLVALDDALQTLATLSPRQAEVIELRFFGGLTIPEAAEVLEVSAGTVKLDWQMAKAWLFAELQGA